jgi:flagella synthesis protein FlgN
MTTSPQQLRSLLHEQRDIAHQLSQILAQEHEAISGNNLQDLETILAAKQQCMALLEAGSQEFLRLVHRQSPSHKIDMTAALHDYDPQGMMDLVSLWRQVEKLLSQCRRSNSVNGKIINLNQRHIQQALTILRNGELGSESCYSPTGARPSVTSSRTLGKV